MPIKKLADKNIRKLTRMGRAGGSLGLTIPIEIVKELKWKERQKVKVKIDRKKIVISDWKK
jgi:antitoxin component of MazEF toxin-antitoxin module